MIVGLVIARLNSQMPARVQLKQILVMGFIVSLTGLLWVFALPIENNPTAIFERLFFPIFIAYPAGALLLGTLLAHEYKRLDLIKIVADSKGQLQAILDHTPAVIYVKDTMHRYALVNHRYEQFFNISLTNIIGKADAAVFSLTFAEHFGLNDQRAIEYNETIETEETINYPAAS